MTERPSPADWQSAAEAGWRRLLTQRNDAATLAVVTDFVSAGLRPIVLKGPATRAALGVTDRPSADIDLLIGPAQHGAAESFLRGRGYSRTKGVHADTWTAPGQTDIDLHWTLPRLGVGPDVAWQVLDAHRAALACAGGAVDVLDPGAVLVHLAIHATMDATGRPQDDLRTAAERLDERDWQVAVRVAAGLGVSPSTAWALESVGLTEHAHRFGPPRLDPTMPHEAGYLAFLSSPVHWRERSRRLVRVSELWVRWTRGRVARLLTGRARTNHLVAARFRRRRP